MTACATIAIDLNHFTLWRILACLFLFYRIGYSFICTCICYLFFFPKRLFKNRRDEKVPKPWFDCLHPWKQKQREGRRKRKTRIPSTVYKTKYIYQSPISWQKKASPHHFYSRVTLNFFLFVFHAKCTLPVWVTPFTWWLRCRSTLSFLLLWGWLLLCTIKRKQSANKRQNKMHRRSVK